MESIISTLILLAMGCAIAAGIIAACREIFCWYAKVNERLDLEKKRNVRLDEISSYLKMLIQIEVAKKNERDAENVFELTEEVPPAGIKS